jgi:c-di-GMP-related signal transduction protein
MPSSGEHFLARQAILDRSQEVHAYELLFRSGMENFFTGSDQEQASAQVIVDSFLVFGIEELTGHTRAFINCTRGALVAGLPLLLPKEKIVVEILETVDPDAEVMVACRELKRRGYTLALDDFILRADYMPLLQLADVIKIDFRQTPEAKRGPLSKVLRSRGITLLAEKIETPEEHREGLALGYQLFQGYYYSRPDILSRHETPTFKVQYLRLLKELNSPELDFAQLATTIRADVSLSLRLLRYINSAAIGLRSPVSSIQQALFYLGEREVRRWGSLVTLVELSSDKPAELLRIALIRARLAELLAPRTGLNQRARELFLMGLFSLLDAMLDRSLPEILEELPLAEDIKAALRGEDGPLAQILSLAMALERGDWQAISVPAQRLAIPEEALAPLHLEALRFPDQLWDRPDRREDRKAA